jgi:hypothetical protein
MWCNSVRALSQRRIMLAKGLPLDEPRRKALQEVYLTERTRSTYTKEHSEQSPPGGGGGGCAGKYEEGET